MATGGECKFSCCSSCLDDERNTAARHYCVDCEMYFCTKCVNCHNKIPATRKHQVNEVNSAYSTYTDDDTTSLQSDVPSESVNSLKCTFHRGKPIDTFCKDHDEVCCGSCVVVKHRACTTLSIAIMAKDFNSSPDMNTFKEALTENLIQCKQEKVKRTDNLDNIGKQKLELIEYVDKYEEKIIAKIKELANFSRNEIRSKYEEHKMAIDTDLEALDVVITTHRECVDNIEQANDEQLFVLVKTSKTVTRDGEMLLETMTKDRKKREIQFSFDQTFEKHVFEKKSLGRLDDQVDTEYQANCVITEYTAKFQSNINVDRTGDSSSDIRDACLIDNNDLILTDFRNKKLKRFSSNLQFKDEVVLSGSPIAVCKTDTHEVAVRIRYTNVVQFVSVGHSMQLTSSFTLADNGYGIMYDAGTEEIFACEDKKVSVYSKTGNKVRTYGKDTKDTGEQIFSECRQIALSADKHDIYVTDKTKGLLVLDRDGALKMKVRLSGVSDTFPLCLLPGHICLAGSWHSSGVIVQVDKDGKQLGNLIDTKDEREWTQCLLYDHMNSRLIVGGDPGVLSVYTLSAK